MKMNTDNAWILNMASQEDGCFVSVGGLADALEQEGYSSGSVIPMRHPVDLDDIVKLLCER